MDKIQKTATWGCRKVNKIKQPVEGIWNLEKPHSWSFLVWLCLKGKRQLWITSVSASQVKLRHKLFLPKEPRKEAPPYRPGRMWVESYKSAEEVNPLVLCMNSCKSQPPRLHMCGTDTSQHSKGLANWNEISSITHRIQDRTYGMSLNRLLLHAKTKISTYSRRFHFMHFIHCPWNNLKLLNIQIYL